MSNHESNQLVIDRPVELIPATAPVEEGFSLKKFVNSAGETRKLLFKSWLLLLVFAVVGGVIGWIYDETNYEPPRYKAIYVFNLETQSLGPGGFDFAALGMGGGPVDANLFTGENFNLLFVSRPLVEKTLLKHVDVRGKKVLLANFYLFKSGIREDWEDDDTDKRRKFYFHSTKPRENYTRFEAEMLNDVRMHLSTKLNIGLLSKKSSFINFEVATRDEILSMRVAQEMLQTITDFYQSTKTRKTLEVLQQAKRRRDSLRVALYSSESQLARYTDQNQFNSAAQAMVPLTRLSRNSGLAGGMYTEALRSVEAIQSSLIRETPLVTTVDFPVTPLPIDAFTANSYKAGILFGLILAITFVILRRSYRRMMAE